MPVISITESGIQINYLSLKRGLYHMSIKMIALDLDGTTLTSKREVTQRTLDAFSKAAAKGVHIVVSTGRPFT